MARLGILLYGLNPLNDYGNDKLALKPCASWRAVVSQVKAVEKDTFVSYGLTYRTDKETVIATVPVGYADGYPRALSSRGGVLIHGSFAPVIGRVCMDHLMADVTRISNVRAGDEVVLIGKQGEQEITAADLAALCGTIPYEILCRIGTRVPRLYEP
jgi:alanine racemase